MALGGAVGFVVGAYVGATVVGAAEGVMVGRYVGAALFTIKVKSSNLVSSTEVKVNVILAALAVKVVV